MDYHLDFHLDGDAFASNQIGSQLWMCYALERVYAQQARPRRHEEGGEMLLTPKQTIWLFGGFYGTMNFLLQVRRRLRIRHVRSFDNDPRANLNAMMINENWAWQKGLFLAFHADCDTIDYDALEQFQTAKPDLIINAATENFATFDWFDRIPVGTRVALQTNNELHPDHLYHVKSQAEMSNTFPLSQIEVSDELEFVYPKYSVTRYMLVGIK